MKINLNQTVKCADHDGYKHKTVNETMWFINAHQGDFIECMTPDGPSDDNEYYIVLTNFFTGEVYQLNTPIRGRIREESYEEGDHVWYENSRTRAETLVEAMKAKGVVDLDFWTKTS